MHIVVFPGKIYVNLHAKPSLHNGSYMEIHITLNPVTCYHNKDCGCVYPLAISMVMFLVSDELSFLYRSI